jgi:hypothetical protein
MYIRHMGYIVSHKIFFSLSFSFIFYRLLSIFRIAVIGYWIILWKKLLEIFDWLTPFFSFSRSYTYWRSYFFVSLRSHRWLCVYVLDQSFSVRFQPISLPFFDSAAAIKFFLVFFLFLFALVRSVSTMKICISERYR